MNWFGKDWGALVCRDDQPVPTPVGAECAWCREQIASEDDGFIIPELTATGAGRAVYHHACFLRTLIGGLNHVRGRCTCCGGTAPPDPPELSAREAARQAVAAWGERSAHLIFIPVEAPEVR